MGPVFPEGTLWVGHDTSHCRSRTQRTGFRRWSILRKCYPTRGKSNSMNAQRTFDFNPHSFQVWKNIIHLRRRIYRESLPARTASIGSGCSREPPFRLAAICLTGDGFISSNAGILGLLATAGVTGFLHNSKPVEAFLPFLFTVRAHFISRVIQFAFMGSDLLL
ncbi:uncharacterized protein LOC125443827 isoform X2 [Sphaerodactylus townsendi]|uniref:uncharacterized protein LOC125443827 isoform X2 n=1 Tax=Sphaerodactylus townsendi TaxID=933632 RepID=UPI00202753D3|nr:uncharacterized protein LOC125443827 isoform X2 [Sphaerodactylus townsendi]